MGRISFGRRLGDLAAADPDRPAITCAGLTTTRAQLESRSNQLARSLAELGVRQGDFVTIGLPNGAGFVEACAACWKLGATPQPVSSRLPARELVAITELANPRVVI